MEDVKDALTALAGDTGRIVLNEFARLAVQRVFGRQPKGKKSRQAEMNTVVANLVREADESRFGRQVADCAVWAREFQVQGMSRPVDTATATIAIDMSPVQRRFRHPDRPDQVITEADLRRASSSTLLLGDPGSGKTTALKRLVLSMFDEIPLEPDADLAYPVVVVCREVDWSRTELCPLLAERFGVRFDLLLKALDAPATEGLVLIAELMDQAKCLLVVDGLDEVAPKFRAGLLDELQRLHRLLSHSRVVCSHRSGNAPHLEGFATLELLPLTSEQRAEIVSRRLGDQVGFFDLVEQSGIDGQLLDRPLFLNHLVRVFEATGAIADRPSDLYGQLVRLMIHEWDEQRRVHRRSEIKGLDATTMEVILREIAFRLTQVGLSMFSDHDLGEVMNDVGEFFDLGTKDGRRVLREIEAQSGFIAETSAGFQFTHFTLQEHLCAQNIVLRPNHKSIERVLRQNPEIAAVAIALSSNPTDWFLDRIQAGSFDASGQIALFVDRLGQERPRFRPTNELGSRLLQLMAKTSPSDAGYWRRLAGVEAAVRSVERTLRAYHVTVRGKDAELAVRREREDADARRIPRLRVPQVALGYFVHLGEGMSSR